MKYHFKVHKEKEGFWAQCIELPGCVTQADTSEELERNMEEALNLYVEEPESSKDIYPFPDETIKASRNVVEIQLDPQIAFAFLVRQYRLKNGLTQKQAAKKMGFDSLYSYQRLEAKRCNPNLITIKKVKETFPEFSLDFALSD